MCIITGFLNNGAICLLWQYRRPPFWIDLVVDNLLTVNAAT